MQTLCTKMSLGYTFSLYAICLVVAIFTQVVTSFTLQRATEETRLLEDLIPNESIVLEVKNTVAGPKNKTSLNNVATLKREDIITDIKDSEEKVKDGQQTNVFKEVNANTTAKSNFDEITVMATVKQVKDTTESLVQTTKYPETPGLIVSLTPSYDELLEKTKLHNRKLGNQDTVDILHVNNILTEISKESNKKPNSDFEFKNQDAVNLLKGSDFTTQENINSTRYATDVTLATDVSTSNDTKIVESIKPEEITTSGVLEDVPLTTTFSWKKYTTINRKRLPVTKVKEDNEEIIKNDTIQTSLQNIITSDIPSLEQLKKDLLSSSASTKSSLQISPPDENITTTEQFNAVTEGNVKATVIFNLDQNIETSTNKPVKWETVESKRAGYLDFSERLAPTETTTVLNLIHFTLPNDNTVPASEIIDNDSSEPKYNVTQEIQIQLKDDAINEELLKETLTIYNNENAQRKEDTYNEGIIHFNDEPKQHSSSNEMQTNETNLNISTDDVLKVKPITGDKIKNLTLYTVSPNYKPLKKLDVQPPKQFIRDPDDNSWRNESISSLGIVFNPKNSSKPFTQVLKNKTETEWISFYYKDMKNDVPDLRERLEKMAKMRKIKKKKFDSLGNVVYEEYGDNSGSGESSISATTTTAGSTMPTTIASTAYTENNDRSTTEVPKIFNVTETLSTTEPVTTSTKVPDIKIIPVQTEKQGVPMSTKKPQKYLNLPEYYESIDEEDIDYLNLAKIDLKKYNVTNKPKKIISSKNNKLIFTTPTKLYQTTTKKVPERLPTLQHFPPLTTQKVSVDEYDTDFKFRLDSFTTQDPSKNVIPMSLPKTTLPFIFDSSPQYLVPSREKQTLSTNKPVLIKKDPFLNKPLYNKNEYTVTNDDNNKDLYIVKNYADFIHQAVKDSEYDKNLELPHYTGTPLTSMTAEEINNQEKDKNNLKFNEDFDYEAQFRKDVLDRFVENFNRNSDRFKSNFPVLFNSSIVHDDVHGDGRDVASSRAFMRGLYDVATTTDDNYHQKPPCDPNCDNITVELPPAYELHYYVPEQEEKEEAESQSVTLPYNYKL